jgi:sialic acid synthase SpsE
VAHALIQVAKDAGAEAVKFQFYTPEGMVGPQERIVPGGGYVKRTACGVEACIEMEGTPKIQGGPWSGESMYHLYDRSKMPFAWGPELKAHCHRLDLAFIASAYDLDGLAWLEQNCQPDAYKVASFEATDTPFVEAVTKTGKPIIVSVGMMYADEWPTLLGVLRPVAERAAVLHCVSAYPTAARDADLGRLTPAPPAYGERGFSDHTLGHSVACAAVAKGACVLEKHIQLHPALSTADSHFSQTPEQFTAYCQNVREAWEACQPPIGDAEKDSRQFRRAPGGKRGSYSTTPNGIVGVTGVGTSG